MKIQRIWAVVSRHLYAYKRNLDRISDSFYWPAMEIIVWGLTGMWVTQSQSAIPNLVLAILTGIVFWQIVWRANYEISVNLLQEFWDQNLVNFFSSPLTINEWITAVLFLGLMKALLAAGFGAIVVFFLYQLNILAVGWMFLPFLISLIISGWIMGFLGSAFIVRYGQSVQTIAWTMGFIFAPFSAVYYPLHILPVWVQHISYFLPTVYIFEGMRSILFTHTLNVLFVAKSFALNIVYLFLSVVFFRFMFEKSRIKGLSRLE